MCYIFIRLLRFTSVRSGQIGEKYLIFSKEIPLRVLDLNVMILIEISEQQKSKWSVKSIAQARLVPGN